MPDHEPTDNDRRNAPRSVHHDRQDHRGPAVARRAVVAGSGLLAVSAVLAGCSSYGDQAGQDGATGGTGGPEGGAPPATGAPEGGASSGLAGEGLARTGDIPVGGGQVFPEQQVVVTQPEPEDFQAFDATCPHQGCTVGEVTNGTINCPCHGSRFAVADGSVVNGPAKSPLQPREVVVEGDWIQVV